MGAGEGNGEGNYNGENRTLTNKVKVKIANQDGMYEEKLRNEIKPNPLEYNHVWETLVVGLLCQY